MKFKFFQRLLFCTTIIWGVAQNNLTAQTDLDSLDLKIGDEAPSFALMYAPGKFEFLKNWSEMGYKLNHKIDLPLILKGPI